jgi:uncharacterized protein
VLCQSSAVTFDALPDIAAWVHEDARTGFEVTWFARRPDGYRLRGCTTALEDGDAWTVSYDLEADDAWCTRSARITGRTATQDLTRILTSDGAGRWTVDGRHQPALDGCLDVDLESSAMTNALPVHRFDLLPASGTSAPVAAPAAYIRALDLSVGRLEQTYRLLGPDVSGRRFAYEAPAFAFTSVLEYDAAGLPLRYPGIARRVR